MDELTKSVQEIKSKNRKSNIFGTIIILALLCIFAAIYLNSIKSKKLKRSHELEIQEIMAVKKSLEEQDSVNVKRYENEKKKNDSLMKELDRVTFELLDIQSVTPNNQIVQSKIRDLQENLRNIAVKTKDTIIVRYYQRNADGRSLVDVVRSIKNPYYYIHYRDVYDDDGNQKVNTFYYGENVKKEYIDTLYNRLRKNGIDLNRKRFKSAKGFEWKKNAIEIGFEKSTSNTYENANNFIRVYSFRPKDGIKEKIGNQLEAKGYQVTIYPVWAKKPSFFSNSPTVLYYSRINSEKAREIATVLEKLTGLSFETSQGNGYGVAESEKNTLFIIHYNGS